MRSRNKQSQGHNKPSHKPRQASPHEDGLLRLAHLARGRQGLEVTLAGVAEENVLAAVVPGKGVVLEVLEDPRRPALHQEGVAGALCPRDVRGASRVQVVRAYLRRERCERCDFKSPKRRLIVF